MLGLALACHVHTPLMLGPQLNVAEHCLPCKCRHAWCPALCSSLLPVPPSATVAVCCFGIHNRSADNISSCLSPPANLRMLLLQNQTCADIDPLTPGDQPQPCPPGDWVVNTNFSDYNPPSARICCMVRVCLQQLEQLDCAQ
jgi:hypothetical protein